jgi:hypothetical protein
MNGALLYNEIAKKIPVPEIFSKNELRQGRNRMWM